MHCRLVFIFLFGSVLSIWIPRTLWTLRRDWNRTLSEQTLRTTIVNLISLQSEQLGYPGASSSPAHGMVILTITETEMWSHVKLLHESLPRLKKSITFVDHRISTQYQNSFYAVLRTLERLANDISVVVIFLKDDYVASTLMYAICSDLNLKWTNLFHRSEWILATINPAIPVHSWQQTLTSLCPDYLNLVVSCPKGIGVSMKVRGGTLSNFSQTSFLNGAWSKDDLKRKFPHVSEYKQIGLEGMHLPIGITIRDKKYSEMVDIGNVSRPVGYAIALLDLLSTALKFEYTLEVPTDGVYGFVQPDGAVTGLTGLLARKDIAFSPMSMSRTENRLQVIDYADPPITFSPIYITYKLPKRTKRVDLTLLDIIQLDFFLLSLAPALVLTLIGGITHVVTKSCSTAAPTKFRLANLRLLASFPDHVCFHADKEYLGQTGRILRGSWAIFWLIIGAAYSAYLVTSFTVQPRELKIDSLEKLLQTPEYRFGVYKSNTGFLSTLQLSNDTVIRKVWQKLIEFNKTDSNIISSDMKMHISRILDGKYALIDHFFDKDIPLYVNADTSDIRSYQLRIFDEFGWTYLSLPKNVFFKEIVRRVLFVFDECGVLRYLQEKYSISRILLNANSSSPFSGEESVPISRIVVIIYITVGGIAAAAVCLIIEYIYFKHQGTSFLSNSTKTTI